MKIINLIAGPRNVSTALMYSFAQRNDMRVLDEPFYAYYLKNGSVAVQHPSQRVILKTMETSRKKVIATICSMAKESHVFVKGMAHHYLTCTPTFIENWQNIILIRHPEKLLASFSKVIDNPSVTDIGIKKAHELFSYLVSKGKTPLVIDSDELLKDPSRYLQNICEQINIPFSESMLSWPKGGVPEDGIWANHWYANVHKSTGFTIQTTSGQKMPKKLQPVLDEALPYYHLLQHNILKND